MGMALNESKLMGITILMNGRRKCLPKSLVKYHLRWRDPGIKGVEYLKIPRPDFHLERESCTETHWAIWKEFCIKLPQLRQGNLFLEGHTGIL